MSICWTMYLQNSYQCLYSICTLYTVNCTLYAVQGAVPVFTWPPGTSTRTIPPPAPSASSCSTSACRQGSPLPLRHRNQPRYSPPDLQKLRIPAFRIPFRWDIFRHFGQISCLQIYKKKFCNKFQTCLKISHIASILGSIILGFLQARSSQRQYSKLIDRTYSIKCIFLLQF